MAAEGSTETGGATMLQPGQLIRPVMTCDTARHLVEQLYGFKVTKIKELISYDDKNYMVEVEEGVDNDHVTRVWPHGYIFKVLNSLDSKKKHIDAEHAAQKLLHAAGVTCTQHVLDKQGRDKSLQTIEYHEVEGDKQTTEPSSGGSGRHIVRLLYRIPGQIIATVPYTPTLLVETGTILGKIDTVLQGYSHPALEGHTTIWNLLQTPQVRDFLYAIKDDSKTELVNAVLQAFDEVVLPALPDCTRSVIHGDFNEQNILVAPKPAAGAGPASKEAGPDVEYEVAGVIDFGDMSDSYLVFELAIAIAYMTLDSSVLDPLQVGGYVLSGYLPQVALSPAEWRVLKVCVCSRYCTSLVMGAYSYMMDPGNEYLLTTAKKGWAMLERLWSTPQQDMYSTWMATVRELQPDVQLPDIDTVSL